MWNSKPQPTPDTLRPTRSRHHHVDFNRAGTSALQLLAATTLAFSLRVTAAPVSSPAPTLDLMPVPAHMQLAEGRLAITGGFSVALRGHDDARLRAAVARALRRWEERTGLTFARTPSAEIVFAPDPARATLVIACDGPSPAIPVLGEDESYALTVTATQGTLRAATVVGVLRGLETWLQLLQSDVDGWFVPAVDIQDRPRFPWRGLMIDVCRHWQPMDVIKRNIDGMALVKLNVLHLHLTEDQGFRIESKTHPRLHQLGSDGHFFTQTEMREIIAYAAERGIRVVPEFDMPGHATSWVVAHPELASAPGPYVIERHWGVFDPVLDPSNEAVYALLRDFIGEMAALFPDPYLHIGGDENNGRQWSANEHLQAFIREHDLKDNAGLHAYFNQRVHALLAAHGKRLVGWDEILHPDLPTDSVVHSWRGAKGLADATHRGYSAILSNGYYIDLCYPASQHYANDPLPADTALTPEEQARVLGGEATMWSEWVSPETIDSRIWPRTAAIAERLWSPREVNGIPDMYRRLAIISRRLEEAGLNHERNRPAMLRRLAGDGASPGDIENLRLFIDVVEPVKGYARGGQQPAATQFTALTGLADCARPESDVAREFADSVNAFLAGGSRPNASGLITSQLQTWRAAGLEAADFLATRAAIGRDGAPVAQALADASDIGLSALDTLRLGRQNDADWRKRQLAALDLAAKPHDAIELPLIASVRKLVEAAADSRH